MTLGSFYAEPAKQYEPPEHLRFQQEGPHRPTALLLNGFYSGLSRSMRRYGAELCRGLREEFAAGWQVEEFGISPDSFATNLDGFVGRRVGNAVVRYLEYPIRASRFKADVFHVLDHGFSHLLLALDPHRSIVTCHDLIPLLIAQRVLNIPMAPHVGWTFALRMRFMKRAACIIADSESTRRDILRYLRIDPDRVVSIAPGVSPTFRPAGDPNHRALVREQLGISPETKVILSVSGSQEYKNIDSILYAVNILKNQSDLTVQLLRAGTDFSDEQKKLIKNLGLDDCVRYLGSPQGDEDLAQFYQLADVFAFPSFYEGFGWPPLEAMRCGTPVVASNAGSLPEVLGDAALLVDPKDSHGLAQSVDRLIRLPSLRSEMIACGLKRAASYSWERTARQTGEVYQRILRMNPDKTV